MFDLVQLGEGVLWRQVRWILLIMEFWDVLKLIFTLLYPKAVEGDGTYTLLEDTVLHNKQTIRTQSDSSHIHHQFTLFAFSLWGAFSDTFHV